MKRILYLTAILVLSSVPSFAQGEYPKIEAYGLYQYFSADIDFLDNESLQGWGAGVQYNPYRWLGAVAEFNGAYGSSQSTGPVVNPLNPTGVVDVETKVHTYLFGPRASWRIRPVTAFGHALFGGATLSLDCATCNFSSNNKFAMALGGGIDINVGKKIAIRAAQFDYVPINTSLGLNSGGSSYFRNWRYQAGVVFKFKHQ